MQAHYVPEFYLRGFTDPVTPPGHTPSVHVYTVAEERWRRRAPAKLARIPDYYAADLPDGGKDQTLERALSELEGKAAGLLRRAAHAGVAFSDVERVHLAEFIGALMVRVPTAQDVIAAQIAAEGRQHLVDCHLRKTLQRCAGTSATRCVGRMQRAPARAA